MLCEGKGQMKAKQLPIDFHEWVKARTFAIDAGIASRVHLPGTIRNAFKRGKCGALVGKDVARTELKIAGNTFREAASAVACIQPSKPES